MFPTSCVQEVPPPTRGWSVWGAASRKRRSGSPAHAGMVPGRGGDRGRCGRFPRPRGDGPWRLRATPASRAVPPPTRGWSGVKGPPSSTGSGSPAHAGMVRPLPRRRGGRGGFPRPRGDGPEYPMSNDLLPPVPPPTRGWSGHRRGGGAHRPGSPAHAGMVPNGPRRRDGGRGFPRPRGDGPAPARAASRSPSVPPPTRGWSSNEHRSATPRRGSPAHAGMVLARSKRSRRIKRFPRPRGDGPLTKTILRDAFQVPPPTRGWSRVVRIRRDGKQGSPAHAGMVPRRR